MLSYVDVFNYCSCEYTSTDPSSKKLVLELKVYLGMVWEKYVFFISLWLVQYRHTYVYQNNDRLIQGKHTWIKIELLQRGRKITW